MGFSELLYCTSESEQEDESESDVESHELHGLLESSEEHCCVPAVVHTFNTLLSVLKTASTIGLLLLTMSRRAWIHIIVHCLTQQLTLKISMAMPLFCTLTNRRKVA